MSKLLTHYMVIFVCIFLGACQNTSSVTKPDIYGVKYAKDLLRAAIEAGIKDKELGQQALKKLLLTESEVRSLFPKEIGPAMALYYTEVLVPQFLEEAPVELGSLYQKGYTYLKYLTVATNSSKGNFPGDLKLLAAFKEKPSLYGLRLMIPKAAFGLRINAWFLFKDRWVTLLKTGELLEPWKSEDLEKYKAKAKAKSKNNDEVKKTTSVQSYPKDTNQNQATTSSDTSLHADSKNEIQPKNNAQPKNLQNSNSTPKKQVQSIK